MSALIFTVPSPLPLSVWSVFLSSSFLINYVMCMGVWSASMLVYHVHALHVWRPEEAIRYPRLEL